jgi:hypothetical protein
MASADVAKDAIGLVNALRADEQPSGVYAGLRRAAAERAPCGNEAELEGRALKPPQPRDEQLL